MIKFTFLFIILYWFVANPKTPKQLNNYITICAVLLFAMMGLRNEVIFGDTLGYVYHFKQLESEDISYIIDRWESDPVFWIVSWLLHPLLGGNYTLWLLLISLVITLPITKWIRQYSVLPIFSYLVLFFLGFYSFFMAGLRQTTAIAITLFAFYYLLDNSLENRKKIIVFSVLIGIASLFHGSALVCLAGLLFLKMPKLSGTMLFFYSIILLVCVIAGKFVLLNMVDIIGTIRPEETRLDHYVEDMIGSNTTYFIQQLLLVVPSVYLLRGRLKEPVIATMCHLSIIGLLFVSLSPIIAEMFRVSFYFSWANIIVFPFAMEELRKKKSIVPIVFLLFFVAYLIFVNKGAWQDYYFWFEDTSGISIDLDFSEL